jgi:hypothetical protein
MVVLDRSLSMVNSHAIVPMQNAATAFVNYFAAGRDKIGLLTYGGTYYLAYRPSINFKTDAPSVPVLISQIRGGGVTNSATALWEAYQALRDVNEPGALNVIVFFTDGRPTAFTGDFVPAPGSACDNMAAKRGVLTFHPSGILLPAAGSISDVAETALAPTSEGCAYAGNTGLVGMDIDRMPATDAYGNSTDSGYRAVNLNSIDRANIEAASINAADSAATRIRSDALYHPMIYTIGLGDVDAGLLQRIANDPGAPTFNINQPAGLFVWSPTTAQLHFAFLRIASEILRLAL